MIVHNTSWILNIFFCLSLTFILLEDKFIDIAEQAHKPGQKRAGDYTKLINEDIPFRYGNDPSPARRRLPEPPLIPDSHQVDNIH